MKLSTSLLLLVSAAYFSSVLASEVPLGRPSADAFSAMTFHGVKFGLKNADFLSAKEKKCISEIPDTSLSGVYLGSLTAQFEPEKLRKLDSFFGSQLGQRFVAAFTNSTTLEGPNPKQFTPQEDSAIRSVMNDPELMSFAKREQANNPDGNTHAEALRLIASCRGSA